MLARIAKNAGAQGLGLLVSFADRFIVVGILLRAWGSQIYSEWALLLASAGLLALGELGLNIYYGNVLQKAWAAADRKRFERTVSIASTCSASLAVALGCLALGAAALDVPALLSITALPHATAIAIFLLMASVSLSRVARGAISQIFRGRQEFALGTVIDVAATGGVMLLTVAAGLLGASPFTLALIYVACDLVAGWGFMLWASAKRYPELRLRPALPTAIELAEIARHVRWLAVQQGAPVAWLQIPIVYLGAIGTAGSSLVSFIVVRTLVNFARTVCTMLSLGSGVEIAAAHHAGRKHEALDYMHAIGQGLSVLTVAMAVGIVLFGSSLVEIWTGRADIYDPWILFCLLASAVLAAPTLPIGAHLLLANSPRPLALATLSQLAIGLFACAALAPSFGVVGAAAGLAIGEAVGQAVILPVLFSRHTPEFPYVPYLLRCALAMTLTALWCAGVGMGVTALTGTDTGVGIAISVAAWGLLGLMPVLWVSLSVPQRAALIRGVGLRATSKHWPV